MLKKTFASNLSVQFSYHTVRYTVQEHLNKSGQHLQIINKFSCVVEQAYVLGYSCIVSHHSEDHCKVVTLIFSSFSKLPKELKMRLFC